MSYKRKYIQDSQNEKNLKQLKDKIKQNDTSGIYIFSGEEEYTKRHYSSQLIKKAGADIFNLHTFYEKDWNFDELVNALMTTSHGADSFSLFLEEKESKSSAQRVVRLIDTSFESLTTQQEKALISLLKECSEDICILFYFYDTESSSKLVSKGLMKKIGEFALAVDFQKEEIGSDVLLKWISRHFKSRKAVISKDNLNYFCNSVGNDMTILLSEIEKITSYLQYHEISEVTKEIIDKVCIKNAEAQIYDISNHTMGGHFEDAIKTFYIMKEQKTDWLLIFGVISKAVFDLCNVDYYLKKGRPYIEISQKTGMKEYPIKKYHAIINERNHQYPNFQYPVYASSLCNLYDKRLKSSKTDNYELLKELIFKLSVVDLKSMEMIGKGK